jgi:hypothetical protein
MEEADLILSRGEIRVPGGWAQAIAVKRGVIVAVGEETRWPPTGHRHLPRDRPRRRHGHSRVA